MKKPPKWLVAVISLLSLVLVGSTRLGDEILTAIGAYDPAWLPVVTVNDGDTITVRLDGNDETVRLIGVDTPETNHPSRPVQCFGKAATQFTKEQVGIQRVRLEADPLNTNRDRYDRLLRYVYLEDGRLLNAEIIKQGYGFAYVAFPFSRDEEFTAYERRAEQQQAGLWSGCQVELDDGYLRTNDDPGG